MDCIDLFKRAAMALQTDPRYVILDQARKANDKDEELQNLIGEFNLARMDLNNEIGKNERDDARIAELNEKVNSLYGQIMGNEGMVAYNEAKRECENLVNYIDAIINTAMNGGDPMTVQEPSASCTGSCATCGGCHSAAFSSERGCATQTALCMHRRLQPANRLTEPYKGKRKNHGRAFAHDAAVS